MARLLVIVFLLLSQSAVGDTVATDASRWIDTQFPEARLRNPDRVVALIHSHAALNDLPFNLLLAVIAVESRFNPRAKSPHGAVGLTQVMAKFHRDKVRGRNLTSPEVAIEVGAQILGDCKARRKTLNGVLQCYNGSSGAYAAVYSGLVSRRLRQFVAFQQTQLTEQKQIALLSNPLVIASQD